MQETLAEVFEYCLMLMKAYYTEAKAFRVQRAACNEQDFVWIRGSDIDEKAEFDVQVRLGEKDERE